MAKKKQEKRPFYDVMHEYQASLKEYTEAAMRLHTAVTVAMHLSEQGVDPKRALEALKEPALRFEKSALATEQQESGT